MADFRCTQCANTFSIRASNRLFTNKFCSRACYRLFTRTGRRAYDHDWLRRQYEGGKSTCVLAAELGVNTGTICTQLRKAGAIMRPRTYYTGEQNKLWSGGKFITKQGYVRLESRIWGKDAGRYEHTVVAASKIGRPLRRGEIVHHKNGNRGDNRPENLEVIDRVEHNIISLADILRGALSKYPDRIPAVKKHLRRLLRDLG